jgi:uncharacterized glyoxalase superfamily protein PhnB
LRIANSTELLGGKIVQMQTHGESPEASKTPPEQKDKILHVHMTIGNGFGMCVDRFGIPWMVNVPK